MTSSKTFSTLAVFAHPGHELRALHALGSLQAKTLFLTDASASTGVSRIPLSVETLSQADIPPASRFKPIPDAALYRALMDQKIDLFTDLARQIARQIDRVSPDFVLTDSAEGYNPAHDICHFLSLAAARRSRTQPHVYDVALNHDPLDFAHADPRDCKVFDLDAAAIARKRGAIEAYVQRAGDMLAREAEGLLKQFGDQGQAREILRPALSRRAYFKAFADTPPFFESHGLKRVREGKYSRALTRDHVVPVIDALEEIGAHTCAS